MIASYTSATEERASLPSSLVEVRKIIPGAEGSMLYGLAKKRNHILRIERGPAKKECSRCLAMLKKEREMRANGEFWGGVAL